MSKTYLKSDHFNGGGSWDPHETDWEEGFLYLRNYKDREGHCDVPSSHVESGFRLGSWFLKQRSRMNTLPDERRRRLNEVGFLWDARQTRWEESYLHLKAYKEREGDCLVPQSHKENGFPLGTWVINQRARAESLTAIRRQQLDHLGFVWDANDADWEEGFGYLKVYKEREGHCQVPHRHIENGFRLGNWVNNRRTSKNDLSKERRQQLDELGFVWDTLAAAWEKGYLHLKVYKARKGDCRVPVHHIENGFRLGNWVNNQRANKDELSEERRQRLDELGFVWNPLAEDWDKGFLHLKAYKEREGDCLVPQSHKENGFNLGNWVNWQRTSAESLPRERMQRLDELGFVWKVRR